MIIYFTGTGNSRRCAQHLAEGLGEQLTDSLTYLRRGERFKLNSDRPWIFVSPTYGWRIPRVFSEMIENGTFSGSRDAYFVMTCGDGVGNAEHYLKKLCARGKLTFRGLLPVVMPENYLAMFPVPDDKKALPIIRRGDETVEQALDLIRSGKTLPAVHPSLIGRLQSGVVNPIFCKFIVGDKKFRVSSACVACGSCAQRCPMNNIAIRDGRPVWGGACIHCMACIACCPRSAIEYGEISVGKPRYQCPEWGNEE